MGQHRRRRPIDHIAVRHLPDAICQGRAAEDRPAAEDPATRSIIWCSNHAYGDPLRRIIDRATSEA